MSTLEAKHLFNASRFPDPILKITYLLLYTPVGITLLLVRLIIGLFAILLASALPDVAALRNTITKLLSFALGVFVEKKCCDKRDDSSKIIISNHISRVDHFVLHIASGSVTPTKYRMQEVLENALGLLYMYRPLTAEQVINSSKLLAIFPEETFTNGKGLLQFKSNIFDHSTKIQPVSLKVWRPPIAELAVKVLGSQWWSDMMTYLFVPCTMYTMQYLPIEEKKSSSAVDFAERIRESIANNLEVPVTTVTSKDLLDYEKRYIAEQRRAIRPTTSTTYAQRNYPRDPVVEQMAQQVKEVLPHVPFNVIFQDLVKTHNVDYTISNILEGHVRYIPEIISSASSLASTSQIIPPSSTNPLQNTTSNFPKSANERMISYQERKRLLIENARKKYIDKHGLNIAMNNC